MIIIMKKKRKAADPSQVSGEMLSARGEIRGLCVE